MTTLFDEFSAARRRFPGGSAYDVTDRPGWIRLAVEAGIQERFEAVLASVPVGRGVRQERHK